MKLCNVVVVLSTLLSSPLFSQVKAASTEAPVQNTKPAKETLSSQDDRPVQGAHTFKTIKVIPAYVRRAMPTGGKSRFYGESQIKIGNSATSTLRVHFYVFALKNTEDCCAIGLYLKRNRRDSFHLISTVMNIGTGSDYSYTLPVKFVEWMWLDNETKRIPMIRFCCHIFEGFYGPYGKNIFLTFNRGLKRKPAAQLFWNSGDHTDYTSWAFDSQDTQGNRQFVQFVSSGYTDQPTLEFWNWDNNKSQFVAAMKTPENPVETKSD